MTVPRPTERADAARNRRAILDATAALLAEHGAAGVTMDRVAAAAGVGKGTIFHRFGSRAGLLYELVAEGAIALMAAVSDGPPPLGPGAPATDRLLAFFDAMTRMVTDDVELIAAYQAMPPHPRSAEFHAFWAEHVTTLLREVRPDVDAETVGALLLSTLGGELAQQLARAGEVERLRAGVRELVRSVLEAA
ncbi:TetR/AcrR family transcriptional regulator [Nocardia asteroides]|uniref:TetR/AcrR family transcriptional regulator n=1 Tax=Nocardia asteroides TaxID=1824 RepID=UPI001E36099E|nr:TetR/AcrR family transcriptional regulator [Nocardia asteroides]UGT56506.1 TetR/AcrR family transcriptional regulator; helix-turn-helix transcriptional regulator [Nocardia asteroides]